MIRTASSKNNLKQNQAPSGGKRKEGEGSVSNDPQSEINFGNEWGKDGKTKQLSSLGLGLAGFNDPGSSTALKMIKEEPDDATTERLRESMIAAKRVSLNGSLIEKPMKELVIADSSMTDNEDESNRQLKTTNKKLLGNRKGQGSLTVDTSKDPTK